MNSDIKAVNDFVARLTRAALPGAHFVEFFPWMMYIPSSYVIFLTEQQTELEVVNYPDLPNRSVTQSIGTRKTRLCSRSWSVFSVYCEALLTLVQIKGMDRPSLVGTLIKDADRYGLSPRENSWVAAIM
jgi:hypothetical protein